MTLFESLTSTLQHAGMRLTPQRMAICKLLAGSKEHPTPATIFNQLKRQYPSLSLATVYNTLDMLVSLGTVNALGHAGDDQVHYDADTSPHINLACISCHKIVDVPSESASRLDSEVANASGYKLLGARVMYYGLCPACQNRPPTS
jgi:Fur family peroxide stress response transcriptional regulator